MACSSWERICRDDERRTTRGGGVGFPPFVARYRAPREDLDARIATGWTNPFVKRALEISQDGSRIGALEIDYWGVSVPLGGPFAAALQHTLLFP
jgi:hypothetical protein